MLRRKLAKHIDTLMESWYLLYCKRGQLTRARTHLERQRVRCLCPEIEVEKLRRDKRVVISEPLFPNYLFVRFDPENIHTTTISATRGVNHFVRFGALPAIVPDEVISALSATPVQRIADPSVPKCGDPVIITEGIFKGLQAIYHEPDGESRAILLLNLIDQTLVQSLPNRQFVKQ